MPTFHKISADEAHNGRKDFTNDAGVMAKGVAVVPEVTRAAKFDAETRTAHFVMSAETPDRMGDIVIQEGLDTTNFEANPQALLFHNSRSWPIGKWANVTKSLGGRPKRTEGDMVLLPEGDDPDADRAAKHLAAGTMRTVSIGFRPDWKEVEAIKDDDGRWLGYRFNKSELLECSLVPIPALPAATMKELSVGLLSAESKELIAGILESFELRDGEVLNRDRLETAIREAEGNRTTHLIDLRDIPIGASLRKEADGTITFIEKASDTPPAPKDGEQVPVQPDPAEDEKQKAEREQAESVALFERHIATAREHARQSKEPGLWAKFLAALSPAEQPTNLRADPVADELAPVTLSDEEKSAIQERIANRIRATAERVAEPA